MDRLIGTMRPWLRWTAYLILGAQVISVAMLSRRGFPYFGSDLVSNAPLWESPVALFHLPGITLLSLTGNCCGFSNSLVLGPKVVRGHIRMTPTGVSILAGTNGAVLLALLGAGWGIWRWRRAPDGPPREPPMSNSGESERP
ncbi:MAG: hypothetical protein ABI742_14505 [Gemmatimonadota bacterium]